MLPHVGTAHPNSSMLAWHAGGAGPSTSVGKGHPTQSRVQSRRQLRSEVVRRSVSVMDRSLLSLDHQQSRLGVKGELDVWPGNVYRSQTPYVVEQPRLPGHTTALARPPMLEHIEAEIRGELSVLAAKYPQFRDAALALPYRLALSDVDDGPETSGSASDGIARWWDEDGVARRPPIALEPLMSDAYAAAAASGRDVYAADRLNVFRHAAKHLCSEFRTYRCVLRSIFIEYDKYVNFCNEFVLEERSALMQVQENLMRERRELLVDMAELQEASQHLVQRAATAEALAEKSKQEADEAKQALEDSIAKVNLVDKIIADAESDKGILARKLIQAEREAQSLQERLKGPEKKIEALQVQLENKETFLKDVSRRYERACNSLDSLKKQLKAEQEYERKQEEERRLTRGKMLPTSKTPRQSVVHAGVAKDMQDRIASLTLKCSMLEQQLHTLHEAAHRVPVLPEDAPWGDSVGSQPESAASSPRSARRPQQQSPRDAPQPQPSQAPGSSGKAAQGASGNGSGGGANVMDSAAIIGQLRNVPPDDRLSYCLDTVSTLLADLAESRAATEGLLSSKSVSAAVQQVDGASLPHNLLYPMEDPLCRFFVGSEPEHQSIFLRATGRVRNQKFSLMSIKSHIYNFFADVVVTPATASQNISERFLTWMRRRYGEDTNTMCYSFFVALQWHPDDLDTYMFRMMLEDKVPESFWKLPLVIVAHIREVLEKLSFKHGGATIPRADVQHVLSTELAAWDLGHVEDVCGIVTTEDVEWRRLFGVPKGAYEPILTHKIRKYWLSEVLSFQNDVCNRILEDPQSGTGLVTPLTFVRAVSGADRHFPESSILELTAELFGKEVVDEVASHAHVPLKDRFTLSSASADIHRLFAALRYIPFMRSCRKAKQSGGIFGLRMLNDGEK